MPDRDNFRRYDLAESHAYNALDCLRRYQELIKKAAPVHSDEEAWKTDEGVQGAMQAARYGKLAHRELYAAVISFQASMEIMLSNLKHMDAATLAAIEAGGGGFKNEWLSALSHLGIADADFQKYHNDIYINMRNPLIHGDEPSDLDAVDNIKYEDVIVGIKHGWFAIADVTHSIGLESLGKEDSWKRLLSIAGLK